MSANTSAGAAWEALRRHHDQIADTTLREFFAADDNRGRDLTLTVGDLYIDYSKHRVDRETLTLLVDLARAAGLEQRRDAMYAGEHINTSEDRAVLHTALRLPRDATLSVDGQDVVADVHEVLDAMGDFTDRLRNGAWTGATGKRITCVVNIGIGGSDLGPAMAYQALRHYADAGISARFVSNVDPADVVAKLDGLDPATTLFVVASKTFTTLETLTNATAARRWRACSSALCSPAPWQTASAASPCSHGIWAFSACCLPHSSWSSPHKPCCCCACASGLCWERTTWSARPC